MRGLQSALLLFTVASAVTLVAAAGPWPPTSQEDISHEVGLGADAPFRVAAMGDWNNDGSIDLLGVASDNHTFVIYEFHPDNHSFVPRHFIPVIENPIRSNISNGTKNETLLTVVVADLNRDGKLDAIVTTSYNKVHLVKGGSMQVVRNFLGSDRIWNAASLNVLDIFGGCAAPDITVSVETGLAIYKNGFNVPGNDEDCNADSNVPTKNFNFTLFKTFADATGFTAGVDFNGDCQSDLVVGITEVGTWRTRYDIYTGGLATVDELPTRSFSVPPTFGKVPNLGDYNGDGAVDFAFTTCSGDDNTTCTGPMDSLVFVLNDVGEMCGGDKADCCLPHEYGYDHVYDQNEANTENGGYNFVYRNLNATCSRPLFALSQEHEVLHSLDWNNDALSDIAIATREGPILLLVQPGLHMECMAIQTAAAVAEENEDPTQVVVPFFYDLLDDGRVDIMTTSNAGYGVHIVWNALDTSEHFFFTATFLNGVTSCQPASDYCWGGYQIGGTHRFQWNNMEQDVKTASGTQISSSQFGGLQFPRMHFGLDKTFGYIFNYGIGMRLRNAKGGKPHANFPAYLVPNSQVMCDGFPLLDPGRWKIILFFQGIRYMTLIVISLAVSLLVIGIPILVLKYREYKKDKMEKGYYAK